MSQCTLAAEKAEESLVTHVSDLCVEGTHKQGGKPPIQHVIDIPLKTILFTMAQLAGSTSAPLASKSQILISLRATDRVVFDWC